MTPTQLLKIKREFEEKFAPLIDWETGNHSDKVWQWFESKLEEVEEEAKVSVLTEVTIAIAEVARKSGKPEQSWRCGKCDQEEMRLKGIDITYPIPEHSIRCSLRKSNKLGG